MQIKKMKIKFCPHCKSKNIVNVRGDNTMWRCVSCGLEMPIFPEKHTKSKLNAIKRKNIKKQ